MFKYISTRFEIDSIEFGSFHSVTESLENLGFLFVILLF